MRYDMGKNMIDFFKQAVSVIQTILILSGAGLSMVFSLCKSIAVGDKAKARVSGGNPRIARPQPHCVRRYSGQRSAATSPSIQLSHGAKSIPNLIHF